MSKYGFTPGEWTVERYGDGDSLVIHSDEDNRVCFMATPTTPATWATIKANALAISLVPEMVGLLERMTEVSFTDFDDLFNIATEARALLAKMEREMTDAITVEAGSLEFALSRADRSRAVTYDDEARVLTIFSDSDKFRFRVTGNTVTPVEETS